MLSMYTCRRWIFIPLQLNSIFHASFSIYINIVIENRADSDVMPPLFSLSKYPIEYLTFVR